MKFKNFFRSHFGLVSSKMIIVLALFIALLLILGDHGTPRVQYIGEQSLSPQKGQFLFRFSRLMDEKSIEKGFSITPSLPGKMSWSGRTFAYTPDQTINYDEQYTVTFAEGYDRDQRRLPRQNFTIKIAPATIAYLITSGSDIGRIQKHTLTNKQVRFLTDQNLFVQTFEISPDGQYLVFLAAKRGADLHDRKMFDLYLTNLSTDEQEHIITDDAWVLDNLRWLPDSQGFGFTFTSMHGDQEGIMLYQIADKQMSQVAENNARAYPYYFSPDSSQLVYVDKNGALILGTLADGKGSLIATTWTDMFGFDALGSYFAYTMPRSASAFDITNVPVLVGNNGEEIKVTLPESSNFDLQFIPDTTKLIWTLEKAIGSLRDDHLYIYDYQHKQLEQISTHDQASDFVPMPSPDGKKIAWLRFYNENKGYVLSGWNDYQAKLIGGEIWIYDMISNQEINTSLIGANVRFIP